MIFDTPDCTGNRSVGSKWNMPMELAFDLCTLALYDIAIYADDSTSMKFAEGELVQSVLSGCAASTLFLFNEAPGISYQLNGLLASCWGHC